MTVTRSLLAVFSAAVLALSPSAGASPEAAGNYGGILEGSISDPPEKSGLINLQLSKAGMMTGMLIWEGQRYSFKGKFSEEKPFDQVFRKKFASSPTDLRVFMTLSGPSRFVNGNLTELQSGSESFFTSIGLNGAPADPMLVENLTPGLRISFIDAPDPTVEGEGPIVAPLPGAPVAEIPGDGFVHVRIAKSKKRSSRLVGRLPDASGGFTAGSPLRGASYAIFSSLYKKKRLQGGQIFGDANVFLNGQGASYFSTMRWGKAANDQSDFYPNSIDEIISLNAVPYPKLKRRALVPLRPPDTGSPIAPFGVGGGEPVNSLNARILFRRGNISITEGPDVNRFFKQNIKMTAFHTRVVGDNPHKVKIQVDAFSGRFRGSFIHPNLNHKTKFRGAFQAAVLLTPGQGRGHFRPPTGPGITPLAEPLESGGVRINLN